MSDIRKWLKIMENVQPVFPEAPPKVVQIKKDATVMVDPRIGGGTGRYMHSTSKGAMIDIKGIARELANGDFSLPERDYEDGYESGNDWFHMTKEPESIGSQNDKPEFRAGDIVKIADVYGTVIGPGMGVFIAYSTTGQEAIVSFDNKELLVPIANVGAALEQNAKNQFSQMDNDGVLGPLSLGSDNVQVQQEPGKVFVKEPEMDSRDEFSKWMSAVEEALTTEATPVSEQLSDNLCGCGNWDCEMCFPDTTPQDSPNHSEMGGEMSMGGEMGGEVCPTCGQECQCGPQMGEVEVPIEMEGGMVGSGGMVEDDLMELSPETLYSYKKGAQQRNNTDKFHLDTAMGLGAEDPDSDWTGDAINISNRISKRKNGIDKATNRISSAMGETGGVGGMGSGGMAVGGRGRKPVEEEPNQEGPEEFIEKPKSGKGVKLGDIIHKTEFRKQGADGEESPLTHGEDNLDEIDTGMIKKSTNPNPQDEMVNQGYMQEDPIGAQMQDQEKADMIAAIEAMQNIGASMANKRFSVDQLNAMTPEQLSQIHDTVLGNTSGNEPSAAGTAPVPAASQSQPQQPEGPESTGQDIDDDMPRFSESTKIVWAKPSLMEQLKWDDEIRELLAEMEEGEIEESSLSKQIGKGPGGEVNQGGQNLVQWLHKKHSLSNDAELRRLPFNRDFLYTNFKKDPDRFIIVQGTDGVAAIRPSEEYIKHAKKRKGADYNTGGDSNLQYQVIAFKNDGKKLDSSLFQTPKDGEKKKDDEDDFISQDPTVIRTRMGLIHGKDYVKYNIFDLLQNEIGKLQYIWAAGFWGLRKKGKDDAEIEDMPGAVERDKMAKRADMKKGASTMPAVESEEKIFLKVKPVLKKIGDQAMSQINRTAQRYINGGNFEAAQKVAANGQKLKQFLVQLDTAGEIDLRGGEYGKSGAIVNGIRKAIMKASGSTYRGDETYNQYASEAARGNAQALKPILDSLRETLVQLANQDQ